ncbi:macro domain-containing protein [Streptomyces collinus]|uniref:Macro domain-containing protein n=1 Tax=Streptomyces collinus (strain DSM 40733 / Tue 365) TaxID=1214242 RepID=S5VQZ1_STRC3|nr:macro domain-containing protein [Streptomyces collinus]AGS73022.1 hypothetical protein B446_31090 [Streptomyces collinus Tu 365]
MTVGEAPAARRTVLDAVVDDLRTIRELGLARLHEAEPAALREVLAARSAAPAGTAPVPDDGAADAAAIEEALRRAAGSLDSAQWRTAALATFGFLPGTRELTGKERRERAAAAFERTVDHFRKEPERLLVRQVAQALLENRAPAPAAGRSAPDGRTGAVVCGPLVPARAGRHPVATAFPHGTVTVTLHVTPIELLEGVDVLVSSENVYFEMSKTFRRTVSGSLRRAGATKDAGGRIVDDVIARQLGAWSAHTGAPAPPVAAGTVAVTQPGELSARGVRRIFHAAVAVPSATGDGYETAPEAVAAAVRRVFELAGAERRSGRVRLRSVALPLLGAGRGGLDARTSAETILGALEAVLAADPDWSVHLVTRNPLSARAVLDALAARRP